MMGENQDQKTRSQNGGANFAGQNSRAVGLRRFAARRHFGFWNLHFALRAQRGFTVIEMLVVVAVIIVVTSAVISNNSKFGGVVLLQNLAYDIALSVRQAQVYGISVQGFRVGSEIEFLSPYGLHFDTNSPAIYITFADAIDMNNTYDTGEYVSQGQLTGGYQIYQLCVTPFSGSEDCATTGVDSRTLDVLFKRPEPDARIFVNGLTTLSSGDYLRARIVLKSPRNDTVSVWIEANGQISVHS